MGIDQKPKRRKGFLSRLRSDEAGNTIAILAAAVIPAIGILGGSVDMSRVFIVRTNLQAACDAGALMGRRVMGSGSWDAKSNLANNRAEKLFDTNFGDGSYGTTELDRSFSETKGKVTGTASVRIPMTLMTVFGIKDKEIAVTCDADMRLPASDIMFVFDTTGSMNCPDDGSSCPNGNNNNVEAANGKIKGLRKASACFYEALTKQNIAGVSPSDCGETANPTGATSDVRLRFGFVPYAVNVNVGKLLPLNYMADQWTYQSREPLFNTTTTTTNTPNYGNEGTYTASGTPSTSDKPDNNWTDKNENLVHQNGNTYSYYYETTKNKNCENIANESLTVQGTNYVFSHQTPDPLVHPNTTVTKYYTRTDMSATYMYKYRKDKTTKKVNNKDVDYYHCQLQYKTTKVKESTRTFTTTTPVTWTTNTNTNTTFLKWHYKPVTYNVSALKNSAGNAWKSSMTMPLGDDGATKTINWNGCIEERQTKRIMDDNPTNKWNPIPADALDMQIEEAPTSSANSKWGPMLGSAIYTRNKWDGDSWEYETGQFDTADNRTWTSIQVGSSYYYAGDTGENCPSPAKLYSEMNSTSFETYLNGLVTGGNTYHDIGLLWGARLMAPDGIFKSVTSDRTDWVERHMIFMTDGDTSVGNANYSAHGVHWWDRRQNNGTSGPSDTWLKSNVDARTQAICQWVRNKNITLWVVAFGKGMAPETITNLRNCATTGRFFEAQDTAKLITEFKNIAATISALRLTK